MGTVIASKFGIAARSAASTTQRYSFFAVAEGMRIPLQVDTICESDAEASLVAITLCNSLMGVKVYRYGAFIYKAPRRGQQHRPARLNQESATAGRA